MELRFGNAWVLYLLWLVPLMLAGLIAALRRRERRIAAFVAPVMQKRLRPKSDLPLTTWQGSLLAAGLLLCMVALARPQWGKTEQRAFSKGRDLVIALDVSRSMLANDVHPNRLERAKIDIMDLLNEIEGDRAALLAFRHKAVALCPLTTDYAFLRHILDMAGPHSAPSGETDIGSAISYAADMLLDDEGSHKAILLISDGEDLEGKAIDAAKKAAERGIPVFTVGFGRSTGSTIPDRESGSSFKYKGQDVVTKLDNDTLYQIAKVSGGAYVPIQTASTAQTTLGSIYRDHLSSIAARELEETLTSSYSERFHYFLLPGLLFLLAVCFMSKGRLAGSGPKSRAPGLKNLNPGPRGLKTLALLAILLAPALCVGETNTASTAGSDLPEGRRAARKAQALDSDGQYEKAAELYLRAANTMVGKARDTFLFNAAASLFSAGKHREAADILNTISGEGSIPLDKLDMALGAAYYSAAESIEETNKVKRLEGIAETLKSSAEDFGEASRLKTDVHGEALSSATAVMNKLPDARADARAAALLEKYADKDAFSMLDQMLGSQRDLLKKAEKAYTTDDPSQVRLLEDLAVEQDANADLWLPLKEKLSQAAQASTNQVPVEALEKMAGEIESAMRDSALSMKDIDSTGYNKSAMSEDGIYRIWKGAAPYSSLLTEDLLRQSNALSDSASQPLKVRDQAEAADLSALFRKRFEDAFPEGAPAAEASAEGQETMTPENRTRIIELADLTAKTQARALEHLKNKEFTEARDRQKAALANLAEIQSLLPKQKQDQQQQDQNKQEDKQDQKENQQEKPEQQPEQQPDQKEQPNQQEQKDPEEAKEQPAEEKKDEPMSESDVKRLLEKALQREKQHEIDKREKQDFIPPTMIDRDW